MDFIFKNASSGDRSAAFGRAHQTFLSVGKTAAAALLFAFLLSIASAPVLAQDDAAGEPSVWKTAPQQAADAPIINSTVEPENNFTDAPSAQRTLTQSVSQAIVGSNTIACGPTGSGTTNENSYWRSFSVAANTLGGFNVQSVSFAIETANVPNNGTQPINVRLYAQTAGTFPGGTRVQIGSTVTQQFATQNNTIVTVPITATVPAEATELIVEINSPGINAVAGSNFYLGSNSAGETGPSYVSAPGCGVPNSTPRTYASIGYPNTHLVINVTGTDGVQVGGTKTVSGSPFIVGNNVTYNITLTNRGALAQPNNPGAEFVDVLPSGLTFVSASTNSGSIGFSGNTLTFNGAIASGSSVTITITATINSNVAGQVISNQGTISYDNDGNGTNETTALTDDPTVAGTNNPTNFTAAPSADLSVQLGDTPDPVAAGANLTYTITVGNAGPSAAASVSLSDTLPANTTFVSISQVAGFSCATPAIGAVGTVTCTNASFAPGSAVFTLVVRVGSGVTSGTTISNTASVSSSANDPNTANNSATTTTTVNTSADLAVTVTDAPDPVTAGTNLVYTIGVTNNGPSDAVSIILTDNLPANTTFVSLSQTGATFTCTPPAVGANGAVNCTRSSLTAGATATLTLTVRVAASVPSGSTISNTATISSATSDATAGNNSATATTTVNTSADLAVTVTDAPDPVTAGTNLTYSIGLTNNGPGDAITVTLNDVLPVGTTFVSLVQNTGATFTCSTPAVGTNGTVSCTVGTLALGATATFTLTVQVTAATTSNLSNTVTVSSATSDATAGNNSATATTAVNTSANLSVTNTDTPDPVLAGNNLTYTITAANPGPSNAATVTLSDTLPAGTTFVSLSAPAGWNCTTPAVGSGGTVTCTNTSFAPGSAVFTLVVRVASNTAAGATITNTVTISSTTTDPVTTNNSATATTTVATNADLAVTVSDAPDPATAGTNLVYTINVANNGPSDALTVSLSDALPAGTTFVSLTQTGATFTCTTPAAGANGTVICTRSSLTAGATATLTLTVRVEASVLQGANLSNTVTISSATSDANAANNTATATTNVGTLTDLALQMTGSVNAVPAGGNTIFTIRLNNNGPSDAQNVVLVNQIPNGTTYQSISFPAGWKCRAPTGTRGAVRCTRVTMAAGDEAVFALRVRVNPTTAAGTTIFNQASVESDTPEANLTNNAASATITVAAGSGGTTRE